MPAITGKEYINRINKVNANIWLEGKKITGNISSHRAFKGIINSQADLYDLQYKENKRDILLWKSDTTGQPIGTSFLPPRSREDLEKRRLAVQEWAKLSVGMLGRSPDYMNTVLMSFGTSSDMLKVHNQEWAENMKAYYEYAREKDLSITHTFVQPQVNRSKFYLEDTNEVISARIIDKTSDGLVIHGARLLATQGGITDEIMVFPSGARLPHFKGDQPYAYAFALPNNTEGLTFICRESFDYGKSHFDHPLGSRFEEMDTIVVFDHVTVPWNRVFLHDDAELANRLYHESDFFPLTMHQIVSKNIIKIEFILGVIQLIVDTIHISEYQHVHEKVSEVIVALEVMKSLIISSEQQSKENKWGIVVPNMLTLHAAILYFPKVYPRIIEIVQLLGASGLITIPTEADFKSDVKADLNKYLQTTSVNGEEKVKLFRLAWDLSMSAFGSRQTQYERYFFGDPVRLASSLYSEYDLKPYTTTVKKFLNKKN